MNATISYLPTAAARPPEPGSGWTADNDGWLDELLRAAGVVNCGACGSLPDRPCRVPGEPGTHLQRFARARRRGLMSSADFSRLLVQFDDFTSTAVVPAAGHNPIGQGGAS